jgi:hypothetical protein
MLTLHYLLFVRSIYSLIHAQAVDGAQNNSFLQQNASLAIHCV